ncbi:MAG: hypothetical protein SGPRY_003821 [Prymnesium sp.]
MGDLLCTDRGPFACAEEGCPRAELSCYYLAKHMDACTSRLSDLWSQPPSGLQTAFMLPVASLCPASCGTCSEEQLRATVSQASPDVWPGKLLPVPRIPGSDSKAIERHLERASELGPLIISDAMGSAYRPEMWRRAAVHSRCSKGPGSPPPAPPWPTIAYRQPSAMGAAWAALKFENGASLGVRDLPSLMEAQDSGRLAGVMLFDSPANHTCPAMVQRSHSDASETMLPAPRFFPRDFEVALGGKDGEGLWRKGGRPWDDPDVFVSKAGTTTHVHVDG